MRNFLSLFLGILSITVAVQAGDRSLVAEQERKLLEVRTLYVEDLDGEGAAAIRDMLIGSIHSAGLFVLTEDRETADAYLRGSAEDLIFTDFDRYRNGINVRGAARSSERESGESSSRGTSFGIGETEEASSRIRKHEAVAAVRIVLANGEVIWTSTQESQGAKYRGSAADVAAKIARELEKAVERARGGA